MAIRTGITASSWFIIVFSSPLPFKYHYFDNSKEVSGSITDKNNNKNKKNKSKLLFSVVFVLFAGPIRT